MISSDGVDVATTAFHGSWRWLAETSPAGILAEHDGLLVAATGLPDVTLNPAHVVRDPVDPHRALRWSAQARTALSARTTGVDLPEGRWPRVEAALAELGYVERVRRPAMVLETGRAAPADPGALRLRVVSDRSDWAAYVDVQVDVFGLAPDVARDFPPFAALGDERVRLVVGAVDDEVVSTAAVFVVGDTAGLYAVATRASWRGRGHGAAVTAFAVIQAAAMGAGHVALQASEEGYGIYRRLGFRDVGDWVVWVDPAVE